MREIDGDRTPEANTTVDKQTNSEWAIAKTRGRWAPFWDKQSGTYKPPSSPARKKARAKKLAFASDRELAMILPLCLTGDELLAERARIKGDGTSFERPRTDEARELVALLPHGRLRRVECMLLVAIAYAMLDRRRHGLVATLRELGALVGLRDTATGEAMARLIALGFVHARETYTPFGACWSQRANLWRLTTQALVAYALRDVPDGVFVPDGTVDRVRLQRRRRCPGIATPRNPEAIQDSLCKPENNPDSFRNGARPSSAVVSKPAAPAFRNFRTAVADASVGRSQPVTRQGESCNPPLRLRTEQGSTKSVVDELAELVTDPSARAAILAARKGGAS